jgi:dTDP-L-rhamnose 4-epimerase
LSLQFDRLIAVDNLHPQIHPLGRRPTRLHEKTDLIVGDVTAEETWRHLLADSKPRVLIHLAAETGTGQSLTEGSRHANVNVVGTTRMLDALVGLEALPERIVLTSSRAVYGEGAWRSNDTGEIFYPGQRPREMLERGEWDFPGMTCLPFSALGTVPHPSSIYAATKLAQEHILRAWALAFGVEISLLRLQNVYGPGQSISNPYTGIASLFARLAREGKSIPIYEDGEIIRDFVYIEDVAKAVALVARSGTPSSIPYDIGSGAATSVLRLGQLIAGIYGAPPPKINGAFRNGDVRHALCDISRTQADLGWTPQWSLDKGVKALCDWIDAEMPVKV